MTTNTRYEEKAVMEEIKYLPTISILQPFAPMMSLKSELEYKLNRALEKVESDLMDHYPADKVLPVILKLNILIHNLNYNTQKKSIAIFVSPVTEKVYYLDILVEEKIVSDESFKIRDLIYSKKQDIEYLVLLLSAEWSKMYLGSCEKFNLIKSNVPENIFAYKDDIAEKVSNFSDADKRKEILLDKFLHEMDEGLSLVLKAYNLPVFVMGTEKVLGHFKKITKNAEKLVEFIHGNYNGATEAEIHNALQPYIADWKKVKQQNILLELGKATDYEKVAFGIEDVWKAATHKNCKLLVVEKDFLYPSYLEINSDRISKAGSLSNNPFYIKDAVDDVIEKVLQNDGDAEFVDNNVLKDYGRIALIKYY